MEQWWESYLDRIERGHVAIQVKVHAYYTGERLRSFFIVRSLHKHARKQNT